MKKHCELNDRACIQNKIAGLGEKSFRKSYYPELQKVERFKALLDQSNDAIFLLSIPEGRFVDVNQSVCDQLGYDCMDILKMSIYDVISDPVDAIKSILSDKVSSLVFTALLSGPRSKKIPYEINARKVNFGGKAYAILVARNIEKRLRTERELRESEEKFRVLAESSSVVIYVYQGENLVYVNDAAQRITGYSKYELLKMKFWDIIHPDFKELVKERGLARQHGEPAPSSYEVKMITKSGETRWVEVNGGRIMFMGKPAGLVTLFDITERKQAAEEIAKLASIVMSSDEAIIGQRLDGITTSWNPGAEKIYGYTADEMIGHSISVIVPPEGLDELKAIRDRIRNGEHIKHFETESITKYGRRINVSITISPILDDSGNIVGASAIIRDITERKQAEESLKLTQFAVDNFTDSSIWLNSDGQIIYVNDIVCQKLGYTRDELLSMKLWDIDPDYTYERYLERWKMHKQNPLTKFESVHVRKDGSSYPVEVSTNYLKYGDKEYLVTFDRDIMERKQREKELSDANAQVELYLDLMGHDINNLNQIALGYLEIADGMIRSGGKLGDNIELIEKPIASLNTSSKLIERVMKLRRSKTKGLMLDHVDLCDVLNRVKDHYSNVTGREITINYVPPKECFVLANELVDVIFVNIIENSIKHSQKDRPLVIDVLQTKICENGKDYFRTSIEDNGPGISDELKEKLFARFSRGETKAKGQGLGLYLIKTLVEDFHGKVRVEDRVQGDYKKGSRFVIELPAAR